MIHTDPPASPENNMDGIHNEFTLSQESSAVFIEQIKLLSLSRLIFLRLLLYLCFHLDKSFLQDVQKACGFLLAYRQPGILVNNCINFARSQVRVVQQSTKKMRSGVSEVRWACTDFREATTTKTRTLTQLLFRERGNVSISNIHSLFTPPGFPSLPFYYSFHPLSALSKWVEHVIIFLLLSINIFSPEEKNVKNYWRRESSICNEV